MRNLFRNRRGSVAFATVVALVPLIGVIALGGEAGTWYVTKQQAQNAADAAAYSGALKFACGLAPSSCTDTSSVDYRGKQFAAQNAFCNAGDTSYPGSRCATSLPSGMSQTVQIAELGGNRVQATVSQQQPAYLATLLGLTTVAIGATAVAQVITLANPCVISLQDPISFQGSTTVRSSNCGLASNNKDSNSIDFTGNGLDVSNAGSISGQGGCKQTGGSQCDNAITFASPVPDPLSGLNAPMASLRAANFANGKCAAGAAPTAYDAAHKCYNDKFTFAPGGSPYNLNGVYFFSGDLKIQSVTITGTATLILLPPKFLNNGDSGATLSIIGNPTMQLTALSSVSTAQVPPALASVLGLMSKLLIYDPETTAGKKTVNISGNSTSFFSGIVYAPNASVQYTGSTVSSTCTQVIAKGVTLSGNSNFDNSGCPASSKAEIHIVRMVQ
jgi:Flp pilus assembly protein TadG